MISDHLQYITAFYCSCNTVPFVLMIIDFLYRYWCIGRPHLISLFSDWRFNMSLVLVVLFEYFLWSANIFDKIFFNDGDDGVASPPCEDNARIKLLYFYLL